MTSLGHFSPFVKIKVSYLLKLRTVLLPIGLIYYPQELHDEEEVPGESLYNIFALTSIFLMVSFGTYCTKQTNKKGYQCSLLLYIFAKFLYLSSHCAEMVVLTISECEGKKRFSSCSRRNYLT